MPRLRSIVVRTASSSVRRIARGSLRSLSVSAVEGGVSGVVLLVRVAVAPGSVETEVGLGVLAVPFFAVCADIVAAATTQRMISNRRTAVMFILLDTPLLRTDLRFVAMQDATHSKTSGRR